jgi:transcriptional regulator with PAS, ATPase and Fis domain
MNNLVFRYIDPELDNEFRLVDEADALKDAFDFIAPLVIKEECCIFLLDSRMRIISGYKAEDTSMFENAKGKTLNLPFEYNFEHQEKGKTARFIDIIGDGEKVAIYLYKLDLTAVAYSIYYLCALLEGQTQEGSLDDMFNKLNCSIIRFCQVMDKKDKDIKFLMRALDSVDEGISAVDKDGRLVYVNSSCCRIINVPKAEMLNKEINYLAKTKPLLSEVLENKKSIIDVEYFLNVRDNMVHLINSGYPVFNDEGEIIGAIDIFRGIRRSTKLANTIAGYEASFEFSDIIGESSVIKEKIRLAKIFAKSNENILIQGESGTGKELFAHSIHNYSHRRSEPFIAINCANFPNELIDSELFGYEEGAFTGAQKGGRQGKFEIADGGTIFLDEIGEMQIHLQAKLLRVVETKTITRIGSNRPINVDVRIIAATNRDLEEMVNRGKFRKDLYYRLKVHYIDIPALRERKEDILVLADYFIKKLNKKMQKNVKGIDGEAKRILLNHDWPGNLRELENTIASALFICDGDYIKKDHLRMYDAGNPNSRIMNKSLLRKLNRQMVLDVLKQTNGNKKKAAEILGVSRPTIYRILKQKT